MGPQIVLIPFSRKNKAAKTNWGLVLQSYIHPWFARFPGVHCLAPFFCARMVQKLELAVSLGFTSKPQHSPSTSLSLLRPPILHPKRNAIMPWWRSYGVENMTRLYHGNGGPRPVAVERIACRRKPHVAEAGHRMHVAH